ncbi:MAG: phage tail protein [Pseudomonadales bacterium]
MPRPDPYRAFRFRIEIDGAIEGGFQSVMGLERQCQIEPYREGGINHYEHQLITLTNYPALVLKRGLLDADLWRWHQDVIDGDVKRKTLSIMLLDERGEEAWRWVCAEAFPSKWTMADLDASANNIAMESIEFVHQGLTRL